VEVYKRKLAGRSCGGQALDLNLGRRGIAAHKETDAVPVGGEIQDTTVGRGILMIEVGIGPGGDGEVVQSSAEGGRLQRHRQALEGLQGNVLEQGSTGCTRRLLVIEQANQDEFTGLVVGVPELEVSYKGCVFFYVIGLFAGDLRRVGAVDAHHPRLLLRASDCNVASSSGEVARMAFGSTPGGTVLRGTRGEGVPVSALVGGNAGRQAANVPKSANIKTQANTLDIMKYLHTA